MKRIAIALLVLAAALWLFLVLREVWLEPARREPFRRSSRGEWVIPPLPDAGEKGVPEK